MKTTIQDKWRLVRKVTVPKPSNNLPTGNIYTPTFESNGGRRERGREGSRLRPHMETQRRVLLPPSALASLPPGLAQPPKIAQTI